MGVKPTPSPLTNSGLLGHNKVLMVFHSVSDDIRAKADHPIAIKALVEFERLFVPQGQTASHTFYISQVERKNPGTSVTKSDTSR